MFKVNNRYQNDATGFVWVSLLLTINTFYTCSSVYFDKFEQVNAGWNVIFPRMYESNAATEKERSWYCIIDDRRAYPNS